jgi:hypothetical protein
MIHNGEFSCKLNYFDFVFICDENSVRFVTSPTLMKAYSNVISASLIIDKFLNNRCSALSATGGILVEKKVLTLMINCKIIGKLGKPFLFLFVFIFGKTSDRIFFFLFCFEIIMILYIQGHVRFDDVIFFENENC